MEKSYFWSTTLDGDKKEFKWEGLTVIDEEDGTTTHHTLSIRQAVLSADAKDGEVNIIEMEVEGYKDKKNKIPIYIGKATHPYVNTLDVLIEDVEATFRLVKGSGPVYLTGTHQVERSIMGGADDDDIEDSMVEEDGDEEEDLEEEQEDMPPKKKTKK